MVQNQKIVSDLNKMTNASTRYWTETTAVNSSQYRHSETFRDDESPVGNITVTDDETSIGNATFIFPISGANEPKVALFYNVYFNPHNMSVSKKIIKEQLEQRQGKSVRHIDLNETGSDEVIIEEDNQQNGAPDAMLYYFTLGARGTMPDCDPCHHLGHRTNAFEEFTIQAMYEYCSMRPQDTVAYFHNKGSFSPNQKNTRLRRHLTKGIFTKYCLDVKKYGFDLCTTIFTGFPFPQTCGNFFTATCDYVNRLIPPKDFDRVKKELHQTMMQNKSLPWANDTDFRMSRESWVGFDRFAMEHWIGSHPSLKPLSVYPRAHGPFTYNWQPKDLGWKPIIRDAVFREPRIQQTAPPFYKKAGRMYLYEKLYGELPPPESWAWKFYFV